MLAEFREGKIIPRSFGHISHLPGSKMRDDDTLLGENEINLLIGRRKDPLDRVIITEKIDGMNASVLREGDKLWPLSRKGYDVRSNPNPWIRIFANYVEDNYNRFMNLLNDGERVCGEWMIKTHTVKYDLKTEPFILFDLINGINRSLYSDFHYRVHQYHFPTTGLVHIGESIDPITALQILKEGYHGAEDYPEGIVYKYESYKNGFICSGKYVSHPNVGNDEFFRAIDDNAYNTLKRKWKMYIPS